MKPVLLHGYGNVDQLVYEEAPTPIAGPGEVLVKLLSTSVKLGVDAVAAVNDDTQLKDLGE